MDFHAAQDPKQAFRSAVKGQSVSFSLKPKYAGAFMYHCGTAEWYSTWSATSPANSRS